MKRYKEKERYSPKIPVKKIAVWEVYQPERRCAAQPSSGWSGYEYIIPAYVVFTSTSKNKAMVVLAEQMLEGNEVELRPAMRGGGR